MNPYTHLNHATWLQDRFHGIGASEIAILCQIATKTPLELWTEKTTHTASEYPPETMELMRAGKEQEPITIHRFLKNMDHVDADDFFDLYYAGIPGKNILLFTEFHHPKHKFLFCHPDLIIKINNKWINVEIKFVKHRGYEWNFDDLTENGIPQKHYLQCQFQMFCSGIKNTILVANYQGSEFYEFPVKANPQLFPIFEKLCLDFWDLVKKKAPPMAASRADALKLFPVKNQKSSLLTNEIEYQTLIQKDVYNQNKKRMNYLKKRNDRIKADVMCLMADNNVLQTADGQQIAKYSEKESNKFTSIKTIREDKKLFNYCVKNKIIIDCVNSNFSF